MLLRRTLGVLLLASLVLLGVFPSRMAPAAGTLPPLSYVSFENTSVGCVAGPGVAFCTRDGGKQWGAIYRGRLTPHAVLFKGTKVWRLLAGTELLAPAGAGWSAVSPLSFRAVASLGRNLLGLKTDHKLVLSNDGGQKWTPVPLQNVEALNVHADIARVIEGKGVYESVTGQFFTRTGTIPNQHLSSLQMTFTGQKNGWLLESMAQACAGQMPYEVLGTIDGGKVWKPVVAGASACWPNRMEPGHVGGPAGYPIHLATNGLAAGWLLVDQPGAGRMVLVRVTPQRFVWQLPVPHTGGNQVGDLEMVTLRSGWVVASTTHGVGVVFHLVEVGHRWELRQVAPWQFLGLSGGEAFKPVHAAGAATASAVGTASLRRRVQN